MTLLSAQAKPPPSGATLQYLEIAMFESATSEELCGSVIS